jgi:hypothetical protein
VQRKAVSTDSLPSVPPIVHEVLRSPGQPLDLETRAFMEPRFGHDFSRVRIHTDSKAAESAQSVNALAYTVGTNIVFSSGQYMPQTNSGKKLVSHELTHVIQQGMSEPDGNLKSSNITSPEDTSEFEAECASSGVMAGRSYRAQMNTGQQLARQIHILDEDEASLPDGTSAASSSPPIYSLEDYDRTTEDIQAVNQQEMEDLLNALRNHEYLQFFELLDTLSPSTRRAILADMNAMHTIQNAVTPRVYWRVQITLRFGHNLPYSVTRLRALIYGRHAQEIIDLLRTYPELTDETQVPGVAVLLASIYEGTPEYEEVVNVATQPTWAARRRTDWAEEAHYEVDEDTGSYILTRFTNEVDYTLARSAQELRVVIRIRFVYPSNNDGRRSPPSNRDYYVPDSILSDWRTGIDSIWNNRFVADNGTNRLQIIFQPDFDNQDPHQTVVILDNHERANEHHWWIGEDGRTVAHEFGHMLGNPDEYNLPGQIAEFSSPVCYRGGTRCITLSPQDELRNSIEGLTGEEAPAEPAGHDLSTIMGTGSTVERRHVWPILEWFNVNMLQADEAPYQLEPV